MTPSMLSPAHNYPKLKLKRLRCSCYHKGVGDQIPDASFLAASDSHLTSFDLEIYFDKMEWKVPSTFAE